MTKLIYIDESGDPGVALGSSPYYILASIIVDTAEWKAFYNQVEDFRRQTYQKFGADFGEFKGSQLFVHQGSAYKFQLKPDEVQWVYEHLMALVFDDKVSRIIVAQAKQAFLLHHPAKKPKDLTKDLRLLTWETFLATFEKRLLDESQRTGQLTTGLVYFDGPHDPHVYSIVNRYGRKYDLEQPKAGAGIVESPVFVDSKASKLIQLADILAYSINYLHRVDNPLESSIRIHRDIVERLSAEIIYPIR